MLALDEAVLAFWKMVAKVHQFRASCHAKMGATALDAKKQEFASQIAKYDGVLEAARRLHNNVPIVFHFANTDEDVANLGLSLREEVEIMREYCGIHGINLVLVVGRRRDELKANNLAHGPKEVELSLAKIKWGPGREMTLPMVTRSLTSYNSLQGCPPLLSLAHRSAGLFGRDSPLELQFMLEKVLAAGKVAGVDATMWIAQTLIFEKYAGVRSQNYSNQELSKKASPLFCWLLRRKAVLGAIERTSAAVPGVLQNVPNSLALTRAFVQFNTWFNTVEHFYTWGHINVGTTLSAAQREEQDRLTMALPLWCGTLLRSLLRGLHEGRRDKQFFGVCCKPPKKGFNAITFDDLTKPTTGENEAGECAPAEGSLGADFKALLVEFEKWKKAHVIVSNGTAAEGECYDGGSGPADGGSGPADGGSGPADGGGEAKGGTKRPPAEDARVLKLRQEIHTTAEIQRKARCALRTPPLPPPPGPDHVGPVEALTPPEGH